MRRDPDVITGIIFLSLTLLLLGLGVFFAWWDGLTLGGTRELSPGVRVHAR